MKIQFKNLDELVCGDVLLHQDSRGYIVGILVKSVKAVEYSTDKNVPITPSYEICDEWGNIRRLWPLSGVKYLVVTKRKKMKRRSQVTTCKCFDLEQAVIGFLKVTRGFEVTPEAEKKIKTAVSEYTKVGSRTPLKSVNELAQINVKVEIPRGMLSKRFSLFSKADNTMKQARDEKGRFVKE